MAYGLLAGVPEVNGLYTSFFGGLIYWIFGTSRHISIGSYAVVSLLVSDTINGLSTKYCPPKGFNQTLNELNMQNGLYFIDSTNFLSMNTDEAHVLIAMSQAFWVGLIHLFMGIFQLGFLASYLSEPLIIGFTAASAVLASVSQFKYLFGVELETRTSLYKVINVSELFYQM